MLIKKLPWFKARAVQQAEKATLEAAAFKLAFIELNNQGYGRRSCAQNLLSHCDWCLKRARYFADKGAGK
jgi:hypothetical protein